MEPNALVIEDNRDLNALISLHLGAIGMRAAQSHDGADGLQRALHGRWALIVLDLTLPRLDGVELCRQLRKQNVFAPLLMLTARSEEHERTLGLDAGADDYLTKPFGVGELMARARALLRRAQWINRADLPNALQCGELTIDIERRSAQRGGVDLSLTAREFDLLRYFMEHPERVFSRAQLLDRIWGCTDDVYEHTVSSHINRLRAKIEPDPQSPRRLVTVWGVGYRFEPMT